MEIPYNEKICHLTDNIQPLTFGYTTSIYKIEDNKIVKVIFLNSGEINVKNSIEYFTAEKINKIEELKKYSVPYYGGSLCPPNDIHNVYSIKLIYDYVNFPTIAQQYKKLKVEDFEFIFKELDKSVSLFNSYGICHNDLHWGNIFYDKINKKILLTDWEKASFEDRKENVDYWKGIIKNQYIINTLFDFGDFKTLKKILKKNIVKNPIKNTKKGENLYKSYTRIYEAYK